MSQWQCHLLSCPGQLKNKWLTPEEPRYSPTPIPIPITVMVRTKETPPAISSRLLLDEEILVNDSRKSGGNNFLETFWNTWLKNLFGEWMLLFTNHLALRRAGIAKSEILNLSVRIIVSLSCQEELSTDEHVRPWLLDIDFVSREVYAVWYHCVLIKVVFLTPAIKIMMEVEKVQALSPTDKLSVMITTEARSVSFADFWIWFSICKL